METRRRRGAPVAGRSTRSSTKRPQGLRIDRDPGELSSSPGGHSTEAMGQQRKGGTGTKRTTKRTRLNSRDHRRQDAAAAGAGHGGLALSSPPPSPRVTRQRARTILALKAPAGQERFRRPRPSSRAGGAGHSRAHRAGAAASWAARGSSKAGQEHQVAARQTRGATGKSTWQEH